jgi:alpha/beta hydrolase family protein
LVRQPRHVDRKRLATARDDRPLDNILQLANVAEPAWRAKPSWYLMPTDDKMISPDAQRAMSKRAGSTVIEVKGSQAVYMSQPRAMADLIAKAANAVAVATR